MERLRRGGRALEGRPAAGLGCAPALGAPPCHVLAWENAHFCGDRGLVLSVAASFIIFWYISTWAANCPLFPFWGQIGRLGREGGPGSQHSISWWRGPRGLAGPLRGGRPSPGRVFSLVRGVSPGAEVTVPGVPGCWADSCPSGNGQERLGGRQSQWGSCGLGPCAPPLRRTPGHRRECHVTACGAVASRAPQTPGRPQDRARGSGGRRGGGPGRRGKTLRRPLLGGDSEEDERGQKVGRAGARGCLRTVQAGAGFPVQAPAARRCPDGAQ